MRLLPGVSWLACAVLCTTSAFAQAPEAASSLSAPAAVVAPAPSRPVGRPHAGCIANAAALDTYSAWYKIMHPDRKVLWIYGDDSMIQYIDNLSNQMPAICGPGKALGVGDVSQQFGGPRFGRDPRHHTSHQMGRDVDVLYVCVPASLTPQQAATHKWVSLVDFPTSTVNKHFTDQVVQTLQAAAEPRNVERIFVNPVIKQALCQRKDIPFELQRKIRRWDGHDQHFHVRLRCPRDAGNTCKNKELPNNDGCQEEPPSPKLPFVREPPPKECVDLFVENGRSADIAAWQREAAETAAAAAAARKATKALARSPGATPKKRKASS